MYQPDWDEWWDIVEACPDSTFFHTPLWGELSTIRGFEPHAIAGTSNGSTWLFPAVRRQETHEKLGFTKNIDILESMYSGTYGGVLSTGGVMIEEIYRQIEQEADIILSAENPISDSPSPDWEEKSDFTQILDLSQDYSEIEDGFSDGRQWGINAAREKGVTIRQATEKSDWKSYFGAYQDSLERWDEPSSIYSWEFFERLFELSQEYPEHIRLWLAEVSGEVASGALIFYWNNHVDYWHASSYSEYFEYQPNDLLQAEIIKDASQDKYDWYDFNPSGGHEGVVNFKKEFGPEKWPITRWEYKDSKLKLASSVLEKLDI